MKSRWPVLVVDDEPIMRESLAAWLSEDGFPVDTAASGTEAIQSAGQREYSIYLVDLKMPAGMDGLQTMAELRRLHPSASFVIMTAYASVDSAVAAMKQGAADYVVKPFSPEEISLLLDRLIRMRTLERENVLLRQRLEGQFRFHDMVSKNPAMHAVFELVRQVAGLRSTVLVLGESGTGKELVARAIHASGDRAEGPFVGVPCAALTETLLESELFGHEKGAFTGAANQRRGKIEMADGGTLFLDEIGDIPAKLQADLLRVLQERRFFRVGGVEEVAVDVRVIAATNRNLAELSRQGQFREDLYYRLNVIQIQLPPLRNRREDIPLLARTFTERLAAELGRDVDGLTESALSLLMAYHWPGNIRELENAVERALVTCRQDHLDASDFAFLTAPTEHQPDLPGTVSLRDLERRAIAATLERTGGNVTEAAAILGIDRSTLYDKLRRYELRTYDRQRR